MTIMGAIVASQDGAVVWCDSEKYRGDRRIGFTNKLAANPLAGCIGCGAGFLDAVAAANALVQAAPSIDVILARLPGRLRYVAGSVAENSSDPEGYGRFAYFVAGLRGGQFHMWRFAGSANFVPSLTSRVLSPFVGGFEMLRGGDLDEIRACAGAQLQIVKAQVPAATGGRLTCAWLTAAGISLQDLGPVASAQHMQAAEPLSLKPELEHAS